MIEKEIRLKIIEFAKDKNELKLIDFYGFLSDCNKAKVRSMLNILVKENKIIRVKRGLYTHI